MKKTLLSIIMLGIFLFLTGCTDKATDEKLEETFTAYIQCIKDYVNNAEYDVSDMIKYTLVYINDDSIPELAISEGDSHTTGVRVYFYDFDRKKTVDTGESYGENGGFDYYDRKNMIYDHYFGNGGYGNTCFCSIGTDYKVTRSRWFTYYSDDAGKDYYWVDFKELSKEEYEKAYKKEAPEYAEDDIVRISRDDMDGDYQACCGENAVNLFFEMLEARKK